MHQTVGVDDPRLSIFMVSTRAYLSFIQHKSKDVANRILFDIRISFEDPRISLV